MTRHSASQSATGTATGAMTRRETLAALAAGGTALLLGGGARADQKPSSAATGTPAPATEPAQGTGAAGTHEVVPLPFAPTKLRGLSEKMIVSHHDNNYAGAVKNLNKVEAEIARLGKDAPAFAVSGLKQSELTYTNSMILHEAYFANLGGDGKAGGAVENRLARAFGSLGRWEEQFKQLGQSLGGGSGWAILYFNFHDGSVGNYWSGNHTQALAFGAPLLVMDMYEHAYQMDYGAAAAKYVDAFFQNVAWDEVNRRLERAEAARVALSKR